MSDVRQADLKAEALALGLSNNTGVWRKEKKDTQEPPSWHGGLVGAVSGVKLRKRRYLKAKEQEKHRPLHRPDHTGTLGPTDIAGRLAQYNNGVPPKDVVVLKLLLQVCLCIASCIHVHCACQAIQHISHVNAGNHHRSEAKLLLQSERGHQCHDASMALRTHPKTCDDRTGLAI